jgi:hypothetical protein
MQINRDGLEKLLAMNDLQLKMIISRLVAESGIDPAQFNMDTGSIESIRRVLSSATDAQLEQIAEQYAKNAQSKRR